MKNRIIFCICTNNRLTKLKRNLLSIFQLKNLNKYNLEIILVSNDNYNYKKFIKHFNKRIKIQTFKEKLKGLSTSRNKILDILRKKKFKYAAFIDDDCVIHKNWLNSMIKMIMIKNTDIVTGPQISKSKNILLRIMERNNVHAKEVKWASTNNVLLKKSALKNKIKFSLALNDIGGEDQLFFLELNKLGKKIYWNSNAPVFELVDKKRENLIWFCKRNLRYGTSSTIIYKTLWGSFLGTIFVFFKILSDFINSLTYLIRSSLFSKKNFLISLMYFLRVIGCLIGFTGLQIKEYK
jgi:succinoglycan biosynthesis protein ExoM